MRKDLSKHNEKLDENNLRKSRAELVKNCKEIAAKQGIPTKQQIKEAFSPKRMKLLKVEREKLLNKKFKEPITIFVTQAEPRGTKNAEGVPEINFMVKAVKLDYINEVKKFEKELVTSEELYLKGKGMKLLGDVNLWEQVSIGLVEQQ